jgi:CRP/FNR family cyclic AMP-dependent transcriptional regulator
MPSDTLIAPFTRVALFDGLAEHHIERIARVAERIVYQKGDVIQAEGDIADAAILLVSGDAEIVDDPADEAGEAVEAGSLIGEMAMLIETRAVSTVIARTGVRAFRVPRRQLRHLMEKDTTLAEHLMAKISERLNRMAAEMRRVDSLIAATIADLPDAHTLVPRGDRAHQKPLH